MTDEFSSLKKIVLSAMFLALGIIIGRFNILIPGLGRIVFNGPFYKFIAIIFGSLYGMIISFLMEFIDILLANQTGYKFLFLITSGLKGFLIGTIWNLLNKKLGLDKKNKFKLIIAIAIPDYFVSFLNTLILKYSLVWPEKTFLTSLYIRLLKDTCLIILNIFILDIMLNIYKKIIKKF